MSFIVNGALYCLTGKADERLVSMIALLGLSAAFDILGHSVYLKRFEVVFGVRETALVWFAFYFQNCCQSHMPDSIVSDP